MNEGADILMVKPGMPYLDIVREVKDKVLVLLEGDSMQPKSVGGHGWGEGGGEYVWLCGMFVLMS